MRAGLEYVLSTVHQGEHRVADHLRVMLERHPSDHEVHHVTTDLLRWSRENLRRLLESAEVHDVGLSVDDGRPHRPSAHARTPETTPSVVLLDDLRELYLLAAETSLDWVEIRVTRPWPGNPPP